MLRIFYWICISYSALPVSTKSLITDQSLISSGYRRYTSYTQIPVRKLAPILGQWCGEPGPRIPRPCTAVTAFKGPITSSYSRLDIQTAITVVDSIPRKSNDNIIIISFIYSVTRRCYIRVRGRTLGVNLFGALYIPTAAVAMYTYVHVNNYSRI